MRTPADYRDVLARWRETAPVNDSAIFARPARASKPRHAALAEQFKPVLVWRRLRSTAESDSIQTNWLADIHDELVAANENKPLNEDSYLETWPTVDELIEAAKDVRCEWRAGRMAHVDGDMERDAQGRLIRLGRLAISDTRPGRILGLWGETPSGRRYLVKARERFRVEPPPEPEDLPPPPLPPLSQPPTPGEIRGARRAVRDLRDMLSEDDVKTLDAALDAANFTEIGRAFGKTGKAAERFGKGRLLAACAALQDALDEADTPLAA